MRSAKWVMIGGFVFCGLGVVLAFRGQVCMPTLFFVGGGLMAFLGAAVTDEAF